MQARYQYIVSYTPMPRPNHQNKGAPPLPLPCPSFYMPCTFLYEGGFIVLLMTLPAYVGIKEMAPIATTRQRNPL